MLLKRYLKIPKLLRVSQRRAEIDAKARVLIETHGEHAYHYARDLARRSRRLGDGQDVIWRKTAVRIAKLTGHEIGLTGSDRRPSL